MRARGWSIAVGLAGAALSLSSAAADPKPKPVDIKPIRDQLIVLTDGEGGTYVVQPGSDGRAFYGAKGKSKSLYEQIIFGRSSDGTTGAWDVAIWAPHIPEHQPASVGRKGDGTYFRYCGAERNTTLTELTGDKAKAVLDKMSFFTSAYIRRPYLLARDDSGVYYYVDTIRKEYGGKGFRVFVGKKGAMKQKPLTDIASDTAGDVFATKTGDLRMVRDNEGATQTTTWVKGEKRVTLRSLDVDANSALIFKELGIYGFVGTLCENL